MSSFLRVAKTHGFHELRGDSMAIELKVRPEVLGARLKSARSLAKLTQDVAAQSLDSLARRWLLSRVGSELFRWTS